MVTLDFGAPGAEVAARPRASPATTSGGRVKVEGRGRREPAWATLTDTRLRLRGARRPAAARYETVPLPENNHQLLRVTVYNGPDDPERIEILDAWTRPGAAPPAAREAGPRAAVTRTEDAQRRETILTLDLGARHQPFRGRRCSTSPIPGSSAASPSRRARIPPRATAAAPAAGLAHLGECAIYRYEDDGPDRGEPAGGGARPRAHAARCASATATTRPLHDRGASRVLAPVERLAFEAAPGARYRLRYGDARRLAPPSYDLARTVGDAGLFAASGRRGGPAAPAAVPRGLEPRPPWTERHPALLWAGLLAVVVVAGRSSPGGPCARPSAAGRRDSRRCYDRRRCAARAPPRRLRPGSSARSPPRPRAPAVIPLTLPSGKVLQTEVMIKDEDRAMGLMFRPSLPADRGAAVRLRAAGLPRHLDEELQVPDRHRVARRGPEGGARRGAASRRARPGARARSTSPCAGPPTSWR